MKTILIYDRVCPKPYDNDTLATEPMGGTEASVVRLAKELSKTYNVIVSQRGRAVDTSYPNLIYTNAIPFFTDVVITLRDAGHYLVYQQDWPKAKHFLWLHDFVSGPYADHLRGHLTGQKFNIITVSDFHKTNVVQSLYPQLLEGGSRVHRLYNIVDTNELEPSTIIDKNKLVYFSSPHKGLEYTLKLFAMIRRLDPTMTLYVANPGYFNDEIGLPEGVINLGSLPHKEILKHVQSALCVFYPNHSFAETFGLVYAEANAVGTPVIAHPIGAAREVLSDSRQLMDCRLHEEVVNKVLAWKNGDRPVVTGKDQFKLGSVIKEWIKVLEQ